MGAISTAQGMQPGSGIEFKQVSFTYPGTTTPALNGVNFTLKPGQKLAIVGENGSGKTTLIKLLTRLYKPTSGTILLDGSPLNEWQMSALKNRTSVIFQDFMRYQFTAGENLGAGNVDAFSDQHALQTAAEKGLSLILLNG